MATPKLVAIAGSLRKESFNKKILKIMVAGAEKAGAEVVTVDIADLDLPFFNQDLEGGQYPASLTFPDKVNEAREIFKNCDGILIACPEYNFSLSAPLKNTIDWLSRPPNLLEGKVVAAGGISPGPLGCAVALEHLRTSLSILNVHWVQKSVRVANAYTAIKPDGSMADDGMQQRLLDLGRSAVEDVKRRKISIE